MDGLKTLAQRLRDKESRDNRALLDEAADAIEALTEDKSCAWCRGEEMIVREKYVEIALVLFPTPHLRISDIYGKTIGLAVSYCPLCGRPLDEEVLKE